MFAACTAASPSDDPSDYDVDTSVEYVAEFSAPRFVVPSAGLPDVAIGASNNNVDIARFEDRLFLAWRTAPDHWASKDTQMHVVSSLDDGVTWSEETTIALGSDVREPRLLVFGGTITLLFFQGGTKPTAFEPRAMWRTKRESLGKWGDLEQWGDGSTVPWDHKVRGGKVFLTSYKGAHYVGGMPDIEVFFDTSTDGATFTPVKPGARTVYRGGVSEVAFEFAEDGGLWAVTRNEDGDETGFGSHVCTAPASDLGAWTCSEKSFPVRYDSPEMIRHGKDLYLFARRDPVGPFDESLEELDFGQKQTRYQLDYWQRPKRSAFYGIDREARAVRWIQDIPGAGDTAFPSAIRTGAHTWLVANYTSPLDEPDVSWIHGQSSKRGTQIYLMTVTFRPK